MLRNDTCRCHDSECPRREDCARWTERDTGFQCSVHAKTLRCPDGECACRLPAKPKPKEDQTHEDRA